MYVCMYLYIYAIICVYYCNYVHWHVLVTYNANLKKEQQTNRTGAPGFLLLLHPGPAAESSWWGYKEFLRQTLRRPSLKYRNISCSHLNIYIFDITKQNHWGSAVLRLAKGNLKVWANLSASSNPEHVLSQGTGELLVFVSFHRAVAWTLAAASAAAFEASWIRRRFPVPWGKF